MCPAHGAAVQSALLNVRRRKGSEMKIKIDNVVFELPPETQVVIQNVKGVAWVQFNGAWYELLKDLKAFGEQFERKKKK